MKDFEEGTRSQAAEIVLVLSENIPATIRKVTELKSMFYPALVEMITCCEEDEETWNETVDDEYGTGNDAYSVGISSLERLSHQMKEKVTLDACGSLISQCLGQADWKIK